MSVLPRILNLGCGRRRVDGAVNVDVTAATAPDVVHDLNVRPWPWPADSFDEILARDVIEHLDDIVATMEEIHRVARDGAVVRIAVPHFSCANAFRDVTHRHYFSWYSFHYFTGEHEFDFYSDRRFARRSTDLVFRPTLVNKVVRRLAARWPDAYEQRWAWMFPAWFLSVELQVRKP
jgi:SAM-dependent methyltransferase